MMPSRSQERRRALGSNNGVHSDEFQLTAGPLDVVALLGDHRSCLGLLVTHGLLTAEVGMGRAHVAWLLGPGDLIRPWEMGDISLTQTSDWRALTDARMLRISRSPDSGAQYGAATVDRLLACSARTSHWLLAKMLIVSSPSITERLLLLFALYGERWGRVTPEGVRIELPLTHELLGKLCGARRPTVTLAIKSLTQDGFITRTSHRVWLLHRPPELNGAYACWRECAAALGLNAPSVPPQHISDAPERLLHASAQI